MNEVVKEEINKTSRLLVHATGNKSKLLRGRKLIQWFVVVVFVYCGSIEYQQLSVNVLWL